MVGHDLVKRACWRSYLVRGRTPLVGLVIDHELTCHFRQAGSTLSFGNAHDDGYTVFPGEVSVLAFIYQLQPIVHIGRVYTSN